MPTSRPLAVTALLALTTTVLAGCAGGGAAVQDPNAIPVPGGTLTVAVASDFGCVDPQQLASNDSIYSARQLVDSLTDQDPQTGEIVPWLAESWEVSADATAFTFHLRDGATFSDGTPVDAAAVKANLDTAPTLGARAALATSYLTGYTGTDVVDPRTAVVRFGAPNAQFLQATATHSLGLVSVATTARSADDRCTGVVGSGPFTLESYQRNAETTLAKRAGYAWGSATFRHDGEAYLDRVVFQVVPESGVRTGSLQSGQVDAVASVAPQDEEPLEVSGVALPARTNPGVVFNLGLNNSRPLFADPAVRKAVSLAVDRQQVVDTALTSQSSVATSILATTTPDHTDLSAELQHDPAAAAALLEGDGWAKGSDGIYAKDGQPLRFEVLWANNLSTNKAVLELLQQQLRDAGIDVAVTEKAIGDFTSIQRSGDFDAFWTNITRADPDVLRTSYSTGLLNTYRLPASPLDDALAGQAAAADPAQRAELAAQAQREIVENAYVVPVVELTTTLGVAARVHDLDFDASSRIQLHDTWVEQ